MPVSVRDVVEEQRSYYSALILFITLASTRLLYSLRVERLPVLDHYAFVYLLLLLTPSIQHDRS
jgi:hypothetical protein